MKPEKILPQPSQGHSKTAIIDRKDICFDELPEILCVDQVAAYLKIDRYLAYRLVGEGSIPSFRFGRAIRISKYKLGEMIGAIVAEESSTKQEIIQVS